MLLHADFCKAPPTAKLYTSVFIKKGFVKLGKAKSGVLL